MSARHRCALPFGAALQDDGRTLFRLWAPAQPKVWVEFGAGPLAPMRRIHDGWFEATVDCGAGTAYRYRLADGLGVPDPASRAQVDDVHGYSVVVDPRAYAWTHDLWQGRPWSQTVLYELHVGACGGFDGVARQLPRLAALGVTAVELMPVNDFPGRRNWGYDGVLPYAPDRAYGTPERLKALIDQAHGLGLSVFLDVVYNHFGPDGNYLRAYAPDFFADLPTEWGPAINFGAEPVRDFFTLNALYWLQEFRFDGLRFDAVHTIRDPDWLDQTAARIRSSIEPDRHVHLVLENDANAAGHLVRGPRTGFDAQWNDDGHHVLHVLLTGETEGYYADYADAPAARLARCLAEGFIYQGERSSSRGRARGTASSRLAPHAFVLFLQNHDQIGNRARGERLTTLADARALRAATALLLLGPQVPLLFMGEEWGCRRPFLYFTDHHDRLADAVREGRRSEFARFAAFADASAHATIPDPNAESTFRASIPDFESAMQGEGAARAEEYRRLLQLRHERIVPGIEGATSLGAEALAAAAVRARWRLGTGEVLTLLCNLGAAPVDCAQMDGELLHATRDLQPSLLPGYCTAVFIRSADGAQR